MKFNDNVPTIFATSLAQVVGLVEEPKIGQNHHECSQMLDRLKAFQQMAVVVPFEEALIAFHGQDLRDEQADVLKIIYKSTKPWMLGHVVGVLLDRLEDKMSNKDFAESIKAIVEQLTKDESGAASKMKGMMVTFTGE